MNVSIKLDGASKKAVQELMATWEDRAKGLMNHVAHQAAKQAVEDIAGNLPNVPAMADLKKSLKVARVSGLPDGEYGYSVFADSKEKAVEAMQTDRAILYVSKTRSLAKAPASVQILEEHGPWTADTIPFYPDRRSATVLSRTVSANTVARIKKERKEDEPVWRNKLQRAGYRVPKINIPDKSTVVPRS